MMKKLKRQSVHDEVVELLPWFVNNSLDDKEQLRVMNHLSDCSDCQQERDRLQQLQTLVQGEADVETKDYKPSFEKLMDRIDESEREKATVVSLRPRPSPLVKWVPMATAASLIMAVALWIGIDQPEPATTLSVPDVSLDTTLPTSTQRLSLTFHDNVDSETLRSAFVKTGAYIVSGPDDEGRYIVEVVTNSSAEEAEILSTMTALDGVKYAALLEQ